MAAEEERDPQVRVVDRRWWARSDASRDEPAEPSLKPTYVEDLERRLGDVTAQLQAALTGQRHSQEEFEQVRLRLRRDVARDVERGRRALLVEFLEVIDNLERAIAAGTEAADSDSAAERVAQGVELVRDQFLSKLAAFGVQRMPALGEPFDVTRHEAVTTAPVDDPNRDGVIVGVIQDGYLIGDEVLRPAAVVVGRS